MVCVDRLDITKVHGTYAVDLSVSEPINACVLSAKTLIGIDLDAIHRRRTNTHKVGALLNSQGLIPYSAASKG